MAARRGKTQARRNGGGSGGLPGWAWLVLGVVLALLAVLVVPRFFKPDGEDGFFRPRPNPDAQPAISAIDEDAPPADIAPPAASDRTAVTPVSEPEYDFYTVLPSQEVAMTDAELAASARAEAERQRRLAQAREQAGAATTPDPDAADLAQPAVTGAPATAAAAATAPAASTASPQPSAAADGARYILQAGAFSASGDAEALKARIALLGLSARVETGEANGKTVHRVRMGPYASATELAEAKQKLGNGGLPALAIKAN